MFILLYHGVSTTKPDRFEQKFQKHLHIDAFKKQMREIKKRFQILTLSEFINKYEARQLQDDETLITFDDCYKDVMNGVEVLSDYKLPAVFSIASDMVNRNYAWTDDIEKAIMMCKRHRVKFDKFVFDLDSFEKKYRAIIFLKSYFQNLSVKKNILMVGQLKKLCGYSGLQYNLQKFNIVNWDDVRELRRQPLFDIIHHSHSHFPMSKYDNRRDMLNDIRKNVVEMREKTGIHPLIFAYPWGMAEHYNNDVKDALKKFGFKYAFAVGNKEVDYEDNFEIHRLEINNEQKFNNLMSLTV